MGIIVDALMLMAIFGIVRTVTKKAGAVVSSGSAWMFFSELTTGIAVMMVFSIALAIRSHHTEPFATILLGTIVHPVGEMLFVFYIGVDFVTTSDSPDSKDLLFNHILRHNAATSVCVLLFSTALALAFLPLRRGAEHISNLPLLLIPTARYIAAFAGLLYIVWGVSQVFEFKKL